MTRVLRPYQKEALSYCKVRNKIALFMEMRLGKSCVVIRWASAFAGRKLILAPLSVLPGWEEELKLEGFDKAMIHYVTGSEEKKLETLKNPGRWFLMNYEALRACPEIAKNPWSVVICDESTKIRNPQAQITQLVCDNMAHIKNRAILSGLPAPESPMDYFQQMKFLHGRFMGFDSYWTFRNTLFFQPAWSPYDWKPKVGVPVRIKQAVHEDAFVLTRKQAGIGPEKIYEKRFVEPSALQKKLYKEVMKTFEYNNGNVEMATKWATVKFVWLARIAGGFGADGEDFLSDGKAKELLNLLQGELKEEKVVVWFRFNKELRYVSEVLERAKIGHVQITGANSIEERKHSSIEFRTKDGCQVMLAQVKCGRYGMEWSAASTAIYYSNDYDLENRYQSEDRILNVDKKEPLLYIDLVTKGTIDESISRVLRNKYANSRMFMTALVEEWLRDVKAKN